MAKYKCPVCGAPHKERPANCRLCGQSMASASAVPTDISAVKQGAAKQKGLGGLILMAIGGVILIGLIAVVLGLVPSNRATKAIQNAIPGLKEESVDGWNPVEAADGTFTAQMPGEPVSRNIPLNAAGASMETVAVTLGSETELSVASGRISRDSAEPDEPDQIYLERLGEALAQDSGFVVSENKETSFAGYPARLVNQNQGKYQGKYAEQRSLLVLAGDVLYVIQSTSVYPDHPQFDRLANSVVINPGAAGTAP